MKKLKNCYYQKVLFRLDKKLGHYFTVYNLNKEFVFSSLSWDTVLTYNKYGIINK